MGEGRSFPVGENPGDQVIFEDGVNRLRNKRVLVTGGGVRLGKAIACRLAEEGCAVCIHYDRSRSAAEETVERIREGGGVAHAVQGDFRQAVSATQEVIREATEYFGGLDFLVNSAAIFEPDELTGISEEHFDLQFAINLKAPLFLSQAFVQQWKESRAKAIASSGEPATGQIVNIVDWRALRPQPGHLVYTMTKASLVALTKMLARELAPEIRVNAIAPGAILPPPGADQEYEKRLMERVPLQRMGHPDDITTAVSYLLHSSFVTGEVLTVTGGESL
jgi:pteridine reductase